MKYADRPVKARHAKFGGLNRSFGAADGEIRDMENMTSDHFPVLASRGKRYLLGKLEAPGGICSWDKLCWVDGTGFYYDGVRKGTVGAGRKYFAAINSYVIIMPDKCYYNVATDRFGSLEAAWSGEGLTFGNGMLYDEDAAANMIRCEGVDWAGIFREGDAVAISGCAEHPENNKTPIIRQIDGDRMYFYEYTFTLNGDAEYTETGNVTIRRQVPDLKFLCENENRLWGCDDSTIYASKPGDPFNWYVYDGLDSDAYFVTPGAAGAFVGGIEYKSFTVCFKEDRIYKIYGSVPTSFKAVDSASIGLEKGSGRSLAVAGEVLFYLSNNGPMAYTGGIPQTIGDVFGTEHFRNAVGGSDGLKYYVSMQGKDDQWGLYVYDTRLGLWHKEDDLHVTGFTRCEGNLYALTETGEIWILGDAKNVPESAAAEEKVEWMVEFADFTEGEANKKEIGRLQIRLGLEWGAKVNVLIQYDSDGVWWPVRFEGEATQKRSIVIPVVPRRCDHYRLKLTGSGSVQIYGITREYTVSTALKSTYGRN